MTYAENSSDEQGDQALAVATASKVIQSQPHLSSSQDTSEAEDTSDLAMLPKVGGSIISQLALYWYL